MQIDFFSAPNLQKKIVAKICIFPFCIYEREKTISCSTSITGLYPLPSLGSLKSHFNLSSTVLCEIWFSRRLRTGHGTYIRWLLRTWCACENSLLLEKFRFVTEITLLARTYFCVTFPSWQHFRPLRINNGNWENLLESCSMITHPLDTYINFE